MNAQCREPGSEINGTGEDFAQSPGTGDEAVGHAANGRMPAEQSQRLICQKRMPTGSIWIGSCMEVGSGASPRIPKIRADRIKSVSLSRGAFGLNKDHNF